MDMEIRLEARDRIFECLESSIEYGASLRGMSKRRKRELAETVALTLSGAKLLGHDFSNISEVKFGDDDKFYLLVIDALGIAIGMYEVSNNYKLPIPYIAYHNLFLKIFQSLEDGDLLGDESSVDVIPLLKMYYSRDSKSCW